MPTAAPPASPTAAAAMDKVASAAARTEIHVTAPKTAAGAPPIAPPVTPDKPKEGSAKDRLFAELRKKVKPEPGGEPDEPIKPPVAGKGEKPAVEPEAEIEGEGDKPAAPAADGKKPKVNPWKLVEEYKAKVKTLEEQVLETGRRAIPEADWKSTQDKLATQIKRNEELEQHMRYVDYSKSTEFTEKYQKPYEQAWGRAMTDLKGLTVEAPEGNRYITPDDLLPIINEPDLRKARELATEKFGDFSADVMAHRKDIRRLYDEQTAALEKARTDATERSKQNEAEHKQMSTGILADWKTFNDEAASDPKFGQFFKPKEGDAEGNQRLAKGFELADRAFSESPLTRGLNAEQRKDIIKRQAVIRNRAAACGRLIHWNNALEGRVKELEAELAQYKGSEPELEGGRKEAADPGNKGTAMERMQAELRKRAK